MDGQEHQPTVEAQPANPQPVVPQATNVAAAPPAVKPELNVSVDEAQALLAINGIETSQHTKLRLPIGMIITIAILVVIVVVASLMLGSLKNGDRAKTTNSTGSSSSSQTTPTTGTGTTDQVNQDVNSCSNIVNAVSEC